MVFPLAVLFWFLRNFVAATLIRSAIMDARDVESAAARLRTEPPVYCYICRTIAMKLKEDDQFGMKLWVKPDAALKAVWAHVKDFPFHYISRPGESWDSRVSNLLTLCIEELSNMYLVEREYRIRKLSPKMSIGPNPPIIIIGLAGTGSSFLQTLLALDPEARTPLLWECLFPVGPYSVHDRIELARRMDRDAPRKIGAELPEECHVFMENALFPTGLQSKDPNEPGFLPVVEWCLKPAVKDSMYAYHRRFLQVLYAQKDSASPASHWVVKDPGHTYYLDSVLKVYPDARVIWTHRNLLDVLMCNIGRRRMLDGDMVTYHPQQAAITAARDAAAGIEAREAHPTAGQFHDVFFDDMMSDPLGTVRAVYRHFGMAMSDRHADAITAWLSKNRRPARDYRLTTRDLGFPSEAAILQLFERYAARFPRVVR